MNDLEKLLDGIEVVWKPLGDIATFRRGSFPQPYGRKEWFDGDGAMPFVQVVDVGFNLKLVDDTKNKISKIAQEKSVFVPKGTVIVTLQGSIGRVAITQYDSYVDRTLAIFQGFQIEINIKYFAYQLETIFNIEKENARGNIIKTITKADFQKFEIPIPCPDNPEKSLKIQKEIVRILDAFTELTTELTTELATELTGRKKQYEYYREQLLTFEESKIVWKTLSDVAIIGTGRHDTKDAIDDGNYTFYARGKEPLKLNSYDFEETAIITAGDGAGVGKVYHWVTGKYALHQRAYRIVPNRDVNARFIYHYIKANFYAYIEKVSVSSSVTSLRKPMFLKFKVPIPSLEEQERIVNILDKFDVLTTSISEGLPKEIELRKKQYEYYRNKLLTFPKATIETL